MVRQRRVDAVYVTEETMQKIWAEFGQISWQPIPRNPTVPVTICGVPILISKTVAVQQ